MSSDHLYVDNRACIDQAIASVCRRQRLAASEAEDFSSAVRLHLIQHDYAVLRKFEHRSSLKTYLAAVVAHLYLDWRNARWGKWRPSAEAKRLGPVAVRLEQLTIRDRLSFDEACETLRTNFQVNESRAVLESIIRRLPVRQTRQFVSDEELEHRAADTSSDHLVRERDLRAAARAASTALEDAIAALPPQDRLIIRMRFRDGFTIVAIARALQLEHKGLYRRLERLLVRLRTALVEAGITPDGATEVLAEGGFRLISEEAADELEFRPGVRPYRKDDGSRRETSRTP